MKIRKAELEDLNVIIDIFRNAVNNEFDEQYKNGKWKYDNERFAVIHRLCVNPIYQNQKIGENTMLMVEELLQKDGINCIRP